MADFELQDQALEPKVSPSLETLFTLVEHSLNNAITKDTGWAWKDVNSAIQIHDIVLSLRHMKHGLDTANADTTDTSPIPAEKSESSEISYFARLLDEIEHQDSFLSGIIRSYLEDAVEGIAEVRSYIESERERTQNSSKAMKMRKLRNAVHCLVLQRESLQFFAQTQSRKSFEIANITGMASSSAVKQEAEGLQSTWNVALSSTKRPFGSRDLSDTWYIHDDNDMANDLFRSLGHNDILEILPTEKKIIPLCKNCSKKDGGVLFGREFSTSASDIEKNGDSCSLCRIVTSSATRHTYYRDGSSLTTRKNGYPVWYLLVGPDATNAPAHIRRGFPLLPKPGGPIQAELIRKWIQDCDANHNCKTKRNGYMPTRLIDLATKSSNPDDLSLNCATGRVDDRYVVLSYNRGHRSDHKERCLSMDKLEQWKKHINISELPQLFQDAVKITRQLGVRYLWIDYLCIVQDSDADLRMESQKMEDVFNSAYLTLSATCSSGLKEGFIKLPTLLSFRNRVAYPFEAIGDKNELIRFYLCNDIDDFRHDVEESNLSLLGWAFQDRALSRRTIHFTKSQLYWECGEGIRSEMLKRLSNSNSALMSDPEFPASMVSHYKGMRMKCFQEICQRYSALIFTHETDRSLAMAGIERRLERVLDATVSYGILDSPHDASYLRRSLLWRPSSTATADKDRFGIEYPVDRIVPTWSWMAVEGPIEYVLAPFGKMDWNSDLRLVSDLNGGGSLFLRGAVVPIGQCETDEIFFDYLRPEPSSALLGVVVGTERSNTESKPQKFYILLVAPLDSVWDGLDERFHRIGVAMILRERSWKSSLTENLASIV